MSKKSSSKVAPKENLYKAIREGDMVRVKQWVKLVNKNKKYPLHWADDSMKQFRNRWWNWLHYSVFFNQLEIVKLLVDEIKIDVNIQTILIVSRSKYYWDDTALHIAAREGHVPIIEFLLSREIKKDTKNYGGKRADEVTDRKDIKTLVETGIYTEPTDNNEVEETQKKTEKPDQTVHQIPDPVPTEETKKPKRVVNIPEKKKQELPNLQNEAKGGNESPPNNNNNNNNNDQVSTAKELKILMENIQREKQKVEDLEEVRQKQERELSEKQDKINKLLEAVNQTQKKCREQSVELEQLKKDNEHMLNEVMGSKSSEETIRSLEKKLDDTKSTNSNLEALVSSLKGKMKKTKQDMVEMEEKARETQAVAGWDGMKKFFEENLKVSGLSGKIKKIVEIHQTLNELSPPQEQQQQQQQKEEEGPFLDDMSKFDEVLSQFQAFGKDVGEGVARLRGTMENEGFLEVKKFFRSFLQGEEQFLQFLETSNRTYERYYRENNLRHERSKKVEELYKEYRKDLKLFKKYQKELKQLQLKLDFLDDDDDDDDDEEEDDNNSNSDSDSDMDSDDPNNNNNKNKKIKKKKEEKDKSEDLEKKEKLRSSVKQKEIETFQLKRRLEGHHSSIQNMDCFPLYKRIYLSKILNISFKKQQKFVSSFSGKGVLMLDRDLLDYDDIKLIYSNNENRIYRGSLKGLLKPKKQQEEQELPKEEEEEEEEEDDSRIIKDNEVVIKVLPYDRRNEKLVQNEVINLLNLKHPNIISIHCIFPFKEYNRKFLGVEMESVNQDLLHWVKDIKYKEDEDLNQLVGLKNKQDSEVIKKVLYQIALGLSFIHSKNIVHRDMKPQNLLVMKKKKKKTTENDENDDEEYIVKIIDFGISKNENSNFFTTMGVHMLSTQRYKPVHDHKIIKKSDVYSFGIIMYEMLVMNYFSDGYELKNDFGTDPEDILEDCFDKLEMDLLCRMLHPNPSERISSQDILHHNYFVGNNNNNNILEKKEEEEEEEEDGEKEDLLNNDDDDGSDDEELLFKQ